MLDPKTGEVLTLTSMPAFDPNDFATGIDRATWAALNTDKLRPLQNRAIQGRYQPGSTFKIVVATAALEEGIITPERQIYCPGGGTFYGRFFKCHLAGGHGYVDLRHAIEKSCNTYFYTVGNMLGVDKMHKWSEKLGLALKSGIDLPNEVESIVPSTEWKQKRYNERWYPGETISVAIGQGQLSVTPMSMAVMMATVANGGTRVVPRLVKAYRRRQGLGAGHGAAVAVRAVPAEAGNGRGGARRPVAGRQRRGHRRSRQGRRPRRGRQDRHRAGDFERRARSARAARPTRTCATTAGSCSWCRGTTRRSPASVFSEHGEHGYFSATVAQARHRNLLRAARRPAAAGPGAAAAGAGRRRRSASPRRPGPEGRTNVRAASLSPHRLGADRRGARDLRARPRDDLQHHRRRRPRLLDAGLRARPRPGRDGASPSASTTDRSPTSRTGSISR